MSLETYLDNLLTEAREKLAEAPASTLLEPSGVADQLRALAGACRAFDGVKVAGALDDPDLTDIPGSARKLAAQVRALKPLVKRAADENLQARAARGLILLGDLTGRE